MWYHIFIGGDIAPPFTYPYWANGGLSYAIFAYVRVITLIRRGYLSSSDSLNLLSKKTDRKLKKQFKYKLIYVSESILVDPKAVYTVNLRPRRQRCG